MSTVDNFILLPGALNDDSDDPAALPSEIVAINEIIGERQNGRGFQRVDQYAGGLKTFEPSVFLFAGSNFGLSDMALAILSFQWMYPEDIQLAHQNQQDAKFRIYDMKELGALFGSKIAK